MKEGFKYEIITNHLYVYITTIISIDIFCTEYSPWLIGNKSYHGVLGINVLQCHFFASCWLYGIAGFCAKKIVKEFSKIENKKL
jgi:hypothetical protein